MSSIPPVLHGGQQKKRNSTIIIVAAIAILVLAIVLLWPSLPTAGAPGTFRSTDVQTGKDPVTTQPSQEVLSPAVNPELMIQERFRAERAEAARLYDNPELKTLDYARPAQAQSAELDAADINLRRYEFPEYGTP